MTTLSVNSRHTPCNPLLAIEPHCAGPLRFSRQSQPLGHVFAASLPRDIPYWSLTENFDRPSTIRQLSQPDLFSKPSPAAGKGYSNEGDLAHQDVDLPRVHRSQLATLAIPGSVLAVGPENLSARVNSDDRPAYG